MHSAETSAFPPQHWRRHPRSHQSGNLTLCAHANVSAAVHTAMHVYFPACGFGHDLDVRDHDGGRGGAGV